MRVVVVRTYVQMVSRREARLDYPAIADAEVRPVQTGDIAAYRETFQDIGAEVFWANRRDWTVDDFSRLLARSDVPAWMLWKSREPAGLIEGYLVSDGSIQYTYVGVRPRFQGSGLGKFLLNAVIERSWNMNVSRIWLITLTSDGEHALRNYSKRGFSIWKRQAAILEVPDDLAPLLRERMDAARARGVAPGPLRILEAHLRANPVTAVTMRVARKLKRVLVPARATRSP